MFTEELVGDINSQVVLSRIIAWSNDQQTSRPRTNRPISVGVDIVKIERIRVAVGRWGERFLRRIYTPAEFACCRGRVPELAARFAAKEAISKALGTGISGITWREMEILGGERGRPLIRLHGQAKVLAEELGLSEFAISLSHSQDYAVAFVVASGG
ncbi:MAG: holo-ACP synthase [Chloroflexota bacterium]|nr:holo-ACP synthase [Chloroflexota bacterium]